MSVIKKGIKMGATGFQQASTQIKKKTANPGLSQIHLLRHRSQTKIILCTWYASTYKSI